MGVYGSPDTGNLYTDKEEKKKKNKVRPQANKWLWICMILWNIIFVSTIGIRFDSVFTALISDSIIMAVVSVVNLIYNLIKKKDIKIDVIILLTSIIVFFILMQILGAVLNSI